MERQPQQPRPCPRCGGTMSPGFVSTGMNKETSRVTDDTRGYTCDNCGYPKGGQEKKAVVNEEVGMGNLRPPPPQIKNNNKVNREEQEQQITIITKQAKIIEYAA